MTTGLGFYFDSNTCIGCKSCESACKEWNGLEFDVRWRQVIEAEHGTFPNVGRQHFSMACNNCAQAPCVRACPTNALAVDAALGIVALNQTKCIGCRYCEWACPYGAIQYHSAAQKVSKCTLCSDRVASKLAPACVTSCPTQCLQFGELSELQAKYPKARPDFPGLIESKYALPNLLCEPHKRDRKTPKK